MRVSRRARIFAAGALGLVGIGVAALLLFDSDSDAVDVGTQDAASRPETPDGPAPLEGQNARHEPLQNDAKADRPEVDNEALREGDMAQLAGIVRDFGTGAPLVGALVVARVDDGNATRTDEHGEYRIDLRFQLGILEAYAPGYLPDVWRYPPGPTRARLNELDPIPARHDFSLVKNPLATDLTVVCKRPDGSTAGGSPISVRLRVAALADANVDVAANEHVEFATRTARLVASRVVATRVDDPGSTRLDVDGKARFSLAVPGRYDVLVRDFGLVASERVAVEGGEQTVELKLAQGVALPVKVIRDGKPVAAAKVEMWGASRGIPETANAGDDGVATFSGLVAGTPVVLRCGPSGGIAERTLDVPAAPPKDPIVLELPPAAGTSFDFTVVAAETGRPLHDARVRVLDQPGMDCESGRFKALLQVRATDLIVVEAQDRRPRVLTAAAILAAGQTIALDEYKSVGTRVRFRVVDDHGAPDAGVRVDASALVDSGDGLVVSNLRQGGTPYSDADGFAAEFAVDLRAGESLEAFGERIDDISGYGDGKHVRAIRVEPGQDVVVTLDPSNAKLRGRVTIGGQAVADGGTVRLTAVRPRDAGIVLTERLPARDVGACAPDGSFEIAVPAGPVTITAVSGHLAASVTIETTVGAEAFTNLDLVPAREVRVDVVDSGTHQPIAGAIYSAEAEVDVVGAVFRVPRGGAVHSLVRARGYAPAELHLKDEDRPSEIRLEMRRLP